MSLKRPTPIDLEQEFPLQELFFSTTDLKGLLSFGNKVFERVSGYTREEFLGQPHNIVRHPDMPRSLFSLFWSYLEANKPIAAYVKNLASNGRHYWVLALAAPTSAGYLSVRLKPTSELFRAIPVLYRTIREHEERIERDAGSRKKAIESGVALLERSLGELGFRHYDHFMSVALSTEVGSREKALASLPHGPRRVMGTNSFVDHGEWSGEFADAARYCAAVVDELDEIFSLMDGYQELTRDLDQRAGSISALSTSIRKLALNATVYSGRLDSLGKPLSVIATDLSAQSSQLFGTTNVVAAFMHAVRAIIDDATFEISAVRLYTEMVLFFLDEIYAEGDRAVTDAEQSKLSVRQLLALVQHGVNRVKGATEEVNRELSKLSFETDGLIKAIKALSFVHVIGKTEAARIPDATTFNTLFDEIDSLIRGAKEELVCLTAMIDQVHAKRINHCRIEQSLKLVGESVVS